MHVEEVLVKTMSLHDAGIAASGNRTAVSDAAIRLAAKLRASFSPGHKVIVFTSAVSGEGVTETAGQVAHALTQMEQGPILLLDANLRFPSLHSKFKIHQIPGLSDLISKQAKLEETVFPTDVAGLSLLPAGVAAEDSLALLSSAEWPSLLQVLRERFQFVIVDSASVLQFADIALIAPRADGVVIVMAAGERSRQELLQTKRMLDGLKANLLGVVLSEKELIAGRSLSSNGHQR